MKSAWRLTLALFIVLTFAACKSTPEPVEESTAPVEETTAPVVETRAAPDPRDYSDERNFDNPESLLSKRVIYFDFDKSTVRPEYRAVMAGHHRGLETLVRAAGWTFATHRTDRPPETALLALYEVLSMELSD